MDQNAANIAWIGFDCFIFAFALVLYFLPYFIARRLKVVHRGWLLLVLTLSGWTLGGWMICLWWSLLGTRRPEQSLHS